MAIATTITASASYITLPNTTTRTYTYGGSNIEPIVQDGRLIPNPHMTNPGVFTAGTVSEGTASNPQNDS